MLSQSKDIIEKHVRTHTERSAEDVAAISTIEFFFRSDGKINTNFAKNDKWPNTDGTFEFVPNPDVDRRPKHSFIVQVKGTQLVFSEELNEGNFAIVALHKSAIGFGKQLQETEAMRLQNSFRVES